VSYFFFEVFLAAFLAGFLAAFFLAIMRYLLLLKIWTRSGSIGVWFLVVVRRGQELSYTHLLCNPTGFAADPHG
jgi:hypothetical protein